MIPAFLALHVLAGCGRIGFGEAMEADAGLNVDGGLRTAVDGGATVDASAMVDAGPVCGDEVVEPPEECDALVFTPGLGCEPGCVSSFLFTGDLEFLASSPPNLAPGMVEADTIRLIAERLDETLVTDLAIDAFTPGAVPASTAEGGVIRAGAEVRIYLVHLDLLSSVTPISGSITFPFDILGLIIQPASLVASDLPTVVYSASAARTTEDPADLVTLGPRTLDLTLFNSSHPDELRVVVATSESHGVVVEVP